MNESGRIVGEVCWGIIGCGDVTEKKSGPAFNKVAHSRLVAVMRRDANKAKDYAKRHGVSRWYDDASRLIADEEVNAIYIATPPSSHETYTLAALAAGKPVYVEKPMACNHGGALRMQQAAALYHQPVVVAHYRRYWPLFLHVKHLLQQEVIGQPLYVVLKLQAEALSIADLQKPGVAWRLNPEVSGGGLFHDLAPHQLDLMYYFFGEAAAVSGMAANLSPLYRADDVVAGYIHFQSGVKFTGWWCYCDSGTVDEVVIAGTKGQMRFPVFANEKAPLSVTVDGREKRTYFDRLEHVQQPMIEQVVRHLRGEAPNPCSADEGAVVMQWMDAMTRPKSGALE